jgi:hypothetical protein
MCELYDNVCVLLLVCICFNLYICSVLYILITKAAMGKVDYREGERRGAESIRLCLEGEGREEWSLMEDQVGMDTCAPYLYVCIVHTPPYAYACVCMYKARIYYNYIEKGYKHIL